jgi:hypothetical protein
MTVPIPKFIAIVCLSIVLIGSGTAWALQNCLLGGEAVEHAHTSNGELREGSGAIEHPHAPVSKLHCPEYDFLKQLSLGPVSSVFRLEPPDRISDALATSSTIIEFFDWTGRSIKPHLLTHLYPSELRI